MEPFAPYWLALISVAGFAIIGQVLSALAAVNRSNAGFGPGELPPVDYNNPIYRICRTYHNTVDNVGTFAAATGAAVLAGAAPFWVNLFAFLALAARLAYVFIYIRGVGPAETGVRSFIYIGNSFLTIFLALLAIGAVIF